MNFDDKLSIKKEYWLNRELSKVKDPKRRQWLAETVFAGAEGYRKFLWIMRRRQGAHEFETGEWPAELPKHKKSELNQKRRPCIGGCGMIVPPRFSPWKELCEEIIPICPRCRNKTKTKEAIMSENLKTNDPLASVQEALTILATGKQTLKAALKDTLIEAKTKLSVLLSPQLGYTFDEIFSDPDFHDIAEAFQIQMQKTKAISKANKPAAAKRQTSKRRGKSGNLKQEILAAMKDGKPYGRPEIKSALEKKGINTSNLYGMSGIAGLVKEGKVTVEGKSRKAVYTKAK